MKTNKAFFLFFIVSALNGFSQVDSLSKITPPSYELVKITELNKESRIIEGRNQVTFLLVKDQQMADLYRLKYKLNARISDTIATMEWDVEKDAGHSERLPDAGLWKRTGERIVVKKSRMSNENKRVVIERKFRIFKWNADALILQDISQPDVHKVYTFKSK